MRKRCGPASPGRSGHAGRITPSYRDGLLSTWHAPVPPVPPTTCHNLLILRGQEQQTGSVTRPPEVMRGGLRAAQPACELQPLRCAPPHGPILHFSPKTAPGVSAALLLKPLMEIYGWCGVSANYGWDPVVPEESRPPFQAQGRGEWSSTRSALVQEITMAGSASSPGVKAQPWREEFYTGYPRAMGFSPNSNISQTGQETCLVPLPALQPCCAF